MRFVPLNAMCSIMCARPVMCSGSCEDPASTHVVKEKTGASGRLHRMTVKPLASFSTVTCFSNEARSWPSAGIQPSRKSHKKMPVLRRFIL